LPSSRLTGKLRKLILCGARFAEIVWPFLGPDGVSYVVCVCVTSRFPETCLEGSLRGDGFPGVLPACPCTTDGVLLVIWVPNKPLRRIPREPTLWAGESPNLVRRENHEEGEALRVTGGRVGLQMVSPSNLRALAD
jgi:hypothetical protein